MPAVLILTPYYRRFALKADAPPGTEACPGLARWRDLFVPRGYALVAVDVRGTGASFGTRDSFRSPRERDDYARIAEWVVAQPWSDGRIGATGISYVGAACDFLASSGNPAVRAIAPLSAVWDTYIDHYYPGGLLLNRLAQSYDALMVALDHDRRDLLGEFAYFKDPNLAGPAPVDDDTGGKARDAAVREHIANFRMPDFITEFRYHDDALPYDPEFTPASFSPRQYAHRIRSDVAVLSVSGWMDGAGYQNGAIARFLTLPNRDKHLLLGPWDHGARINVSPWRRAETPEFSLDGELLRFFDTYLMELETGLSREAPVHYFTMHGETWREATEWPPSPNTRRLFLAEGGALSAAPGSGEDRFTADFGFGSGTHTRYGRLAAHDTRIYYDDWQPREATLPCFRSEPLDTADRTRRARGADAESGSLRARCGAACVSVGRGTRRRRALRDRGRVTGAPPEALDLSAGLSRKLALPQLRPRRCGPAGSRPAGRDRHRAAADRLALRQGQPHPVGNRRRRRRPLRPGAAWPPARLYDRPG